MPPTAQTDPIAQPAATAQTGGNPPPPRRPRASRSSAIRTSTVTGA